MTLSFHELIRRAERKSLWVSERGTSYVELSGGSDNVCQFPVMKLSLFLV